MEVNVSRAQTKRFAEKQGVELLLERRASSTPVNNSSLQNFTIIPPQLSSVKKIVTSDRRTCKLEDKQTFISSLRVATPSRFNFFLQFFNFSINSYEKSTNIQRMEQVANFGRFLLILGTFLVIIQLLPLTEASEPLRNPYEILGVSRRATLQEIRKAYKNLVKEWHPDKTDHPAAENKFVEITRAYEVNHQFYAFHKYSFSLRCLLQFYFKHSQLLSDPERRRKYDNHGLTEESTRQRGENSHFHMPDPLEELFTGNFKFHYQNRDISFFHEMSITYRSVKIFLVPFQYNCA